MDLLEGTERGEASPHRTRYSAEVLNEVTMEEVLAASSYHGRTQWVNPHCRVQPPDAENRLSGGVGGSRCAIAVTRPDRSRLKPTNDSWRVDETYIRVKGNWRYLYRAVDSSGATLDFLLSAKQDAAAAKRFLTKALGRANHQAPRVINTDKHAAYPPAIVQTKKPRVF